MSAEPSIKPIRVLQFGRFYPPHEGGIETVMFNLAEGLNAHGIRCDVLCSNKTADYREDTHGAYTVYRTRTYGEFQSTSITPQLVSKFGELSDNYDIIHIHHPDPVAALALLWRNPKAKVVLHWHSDIIRQKTLLRLYRPLIQTPILNRADCIIATTGDYVKASADLQPFAEKVEVIPIGIPDKKDPDPVALQEIREKYKGKKIVFSLGRMVPYKGFEYLIRAAQKFDDNIVTVIGGNGPLRTKLLALVDELKLNDRVILPGRIDEKELPAYLQAADVFCLSSIARTEAFAIVMVEAMTFGRPIVATNIEGSGVPWVSQDNVTGLNVPVEDPDAIAQAINKIVSDDSLATKFSKASRQRYENEFTIGKMIDSTIALYNRLLA